jgi:hypothetical protein
MKLGLGDRKAQVAVYIIIAVLIVGGVILFFTLRDKGTGVGGIPEELSPVFEYYLGCIELEAKAGVQIAGGQGGRIDTSDYIPGSEYAPFSSQLNFLENPIPYWYYVSGNGLIKEQVPTKVEMENEIERFVEEGIRNCEFELYERDGFEVELEGGDVEIEVLDRRVRVEVVGDLIVSKGEENARKTTHIVEFDSKLGKFFNLAREIYNEQKQEAFLENYAVDVMYLHAPVEGVIIQCGPEVWSTEKVIMDLKKGLEENIDTIKFEGDYYQVSGDREYFVVDKQVDESVNVMYSEEWPTKVEIYGDDVDESVMVAQTIGTQEGMGIMGFCYVPYHFVYDLSFPVLIQVYDTEELFQFPVVVVIDNNLPREAFLPDTQIQEIEDFDLCEFETEKVEVYTFDNNLNEVNVNLSYECFDQSCRLGESENGKFVGTLPACVNGYLRLNTEGFAEEKMLYSSNRESVVDVVLEREYDIEVEVEMDGGKFVGTAIVSFVSGDGITRSVALPQQDKIVLTEGSYEVKVYIYGESSVIIPPSSKTECVDVPNVGILGLFGGDKEECFEINTPETKIEFALVGGGKLSSYLLESELEEGKLTIRASSLPRPNSIDDLANNFEIFETRRLSLSFHE